MAMALFIIGSLALEAATGFGALLLALSVGTLLFPAPQLLGLLVPLNLLLAGALVIRLRRHLQPELLVKMVAPLLIAGTLAGWWLQPWLQKPWLGIFFALVIVVLSGRALWLARRGTAYQQPPWASRLQIMGAGFSHGIFGSGGPLLVFALAGTRASRAQLRALLACAWFSLCLGLAALQLLQQPWPVDLRNGLALLLPVGLVALMASWLGRRLPDSWFRPLVYWLLMGTGLVLLARAVTALI